MSFVTSVYPPRKIVEVTQREDDKPEWNCLREEIRAILEANIKEFWEDDKEGEI